MSINLRLRGPAGASTLSLSAEATLSTLKTKIQELTSISTPRQDLRLGFPPKPIDPSATSETTLSSLGVRNGDSIIVSEGEASSAAASTPIPAPPPVAAVAPPARAPAPSAPIVSRAPVVTPTARATGSAPESVELDGGYLVLRVVPDDNSCLFTAIGLVLEPGRKDAASHLRSRVADTIRSSPNLWSDAVLGQSRDSYITAILKPNTWGGAIELSIFASLYQTEICSVDVQTGRVDRFGEGEGHENVALVVYSGIHYDALTFSFIPPTPPTSSIFPPENLEFDTTVFPSFGSDELLIAALKLVTKLRAEHKYTDAATFTLKCEVCGKAIVGEKDARKHAEETGHANFGEYDG